MIIAPIIASVIMGVSTYLINQALNNIVRMSISTILSIIFGALIYIVLIFALKILRKEDIMMIPFGSKIYSVLIKLKIYKEEN